MEQDKTSVHQKILNLSYNCVSRFFERYTKPQNSS
jgi:hypothetical protein